MFVLPITFGLLSCSVVVGAKKLSVLAAGKSASMNGKATAIKTDSDDNFGNC